MGEDRSLGAIMRAFILLVLTCTFAGTNVVSAKPWREVLQAGISMYQSDGEQSCDAGVSSFWDTIKQRKTVNKGRFCPAAAKNILHRLSGLATQYLSEPGVELAPHVAVACGHLNYGLIKHVIAESEHKDIGLIHYLCNGEWQISNNQMIVAFCLRCCQTTC